MVLAGKSIILGALSLILGDRVDTSVLINRTEKCIVEAVFSTEEHLINIFAAILSGDLDRIASRDRSDFDNRFNRARKFETVCPAN